jgi:hypothetical protein
MTVADKHSSLPWYRVDKDSKKFYIIAIYDLISPKFNSVVKVYLQILQGTPVMLPTRSVESTINVVRLQMTIVSKFSIGAQLTTLVT